ncbi:MAG: hypothetical protein AAB336_10815, partial [Acidobacteriota bacterium]
MKKILIVISILLSLNLVLSAQEKDAFLQTMPESSVLKTTLTVRCVRDLNYWKQPALKNFWSWMPKLQFAVSGPIADASYFTYEFFTPDGKPWFTADSEPFAIGQGEYKLFESEAVPRWTDKRSSIQTGI